MSRFNTGNPIGSADPRDRDDNSKNLDEAVNDLNSETWIDRFGVERPTLKLLGDLEEAASVIVGAGEDVTRAWQSAIRSDVRYRVADNLLAYSGSLADGEATNRPPITVTGDATYLISQGATGAALSVAAPATIALRELVNVPIDEVLEIHFVSGVADGALNENLEVGIALYDNEKNRLTATPSVYFYDAPMVDPTYRNSVTVGVDGSGAEYEFPSDAVYFTPYISTESTTGRFWASEITVNRFVDDAENVIYPSLEFDAFVGQSAINYSHEYESASVTVASDGSVVYGLSGARIGLIAGTTRDTVALRGLLTVNQDSSLDYDVNYAIAALSDDAGTVEIGASWFDSTRDFISTTSVKSFDNSDVLDSVTKNTLRADMFVAPPGARYARPFIRISGASGNLAVLKFYATYVDKSEFYNEGMTAHPSRVLAGASNINAYDPASPSSMTLLSGNAQTLEDSIGGQPFEALGGSFVRPEYRVLDAYPSLSSPVSSAAKARMTVREGVIYSPPCTLVFAARADSSVDRLRPLIHHNAGIGNKLRINANAVKDANGLWYSQLDRVGIEIEGVSGGLSSDGNPVAAYAPQDKWNVFSLLLKLPPERSEWWCNGQLVDTFLAPASLTTGRTDLFSGDGTRWDTNGVALGRICSADVAASDDERIALEKWAADPGGNPVSTRRTVQKPVIDAASVCAMRVSDGKILFDQDANVRVNPASVNKVMTAMIADKWIVDFDSHDVEITSDNSPRFEIGDIMSMESAMQAMLIPSDNAAPGAVGNAVGEFIQSVEGVQNGESPAQRGYREMWRVAETLGFTYTEFAGFISYALYSGLDLCKMMVGVNRSQRLMSIMSRSYGESVITGGPNPRTETFDTTVKFLDAGFPRLQGVLAGKTGTLQVSGNSLVILAEMPGGDIVAFAMAQGNISEDRYDQMRQVMNYVERSFY